MFSTNLYTVITQKHAWMSENTNLKLSSAPPTTTMLLSARIFSLNSSMFSGLHCSAFWPTTNSTGVFMSNSGSSTSWQTKHKHYNSASNFLKVSAKWFHVAHHDKEQCTLSEKLWTVFPHPSWSTDSLKRETQTHNSRHVLHKGHLGAKIDIYEFINFQPTIDNKLEK